MRELHSTYEGLELRRVRLAFVQLPFGRLRTPGDLVQQELHPLLLRTRLGISPGDLLLLCAHRAPRLTLGCPLLARVVERLARRVELLHEGLCALLESSALLGAEAKPLRRIGELGLVTPHLGRFALGLEGRCTRSGTLRRRLLLRVAHGRQSAGALRLGRLKLARCLLLGRLGRAHRRLQRIELPKRLMRAALRFGELPRLHAQLGLEPLHLHLGALLIHRGLREGRLVLRKGRGRGANAVGDLLQPSHLLHEARDLCLRLPTGLRRLERVRSLHLGRSHQRALLRLHLPDALAQLLELRARHGARLALRPQQLAQMLSLSHEALSLLVEGGELATQLSAVEPAALRLALQLREGRLGLGRTRLQLLDLLLAGAQERARLRERRHVRLESLLRGLVLRQQAGAPRLEGISLTAQLRGSGGEGVRVARGRVQARLERLACGLCLRHRLLGRGRALHRCFETTAQLARLGAGHLEGLREPGTIRLVGRVDLAHVRSLGLGPCRTFLAQGSEGVVEARTEGAELERVGMRLEATTSSPSPSPSAATAAAAAAAFVATAAILRILDHTASSTGEASARAKPPPRPGRLLQPESSQLVIQLLAREELTLQCLLVVAQLANGAHKSVDPRLRLGRGLRLTTRLCQLRLQCRTLAVQEIDLVVELCDREVLLFVDVHSGELRALAHLSRRPLQTLQLRITPNGRLAQCLALHFEPRRTRLRVFETKL